MPFTIGADTLRVPFTIGADTHRVPFTIGADTLRVPLIELIISCRVNLSDQVKNSYLYAI